MHVAKLHQVVNVFFAIYVAAIMVSLGLAVYPLGWNNREVQESCGNASQAYKLGELSNYFETKFACDKFRC